MKVDIKSPAIGFLLSAVVFLALGAKQSTDSHSCCRYQIAAAEYHAYVIDTTTGKVWKKSTTGKGPFWDSKNRPKQTNNDAQVK
jgi:hypothetical protein